MVAGRVRTLSTFTWRRPRMAPRPTGAPFPFPFPLPPLSPAPPKKQNVLHGSPHKQEHHLLDHLNPADCTALSLLIPFIPLAQIPNEGQVPIKGLSPVLYTEHANLMLCQTLVHSYNPWYIIYKGQHFGKIMHYSHHTIISWYLDTEMLHISYTRPPCICIYQWTSASFVQAERLLQAAFLYVH
jgi:hypothetical protein